MSIKDKTVAICGLGYVGYPVAMLFADAGFNVIGFDVLEERVKKLNEGYNPIKGQEPGLDELVEGVFKKGNFRATTDMSEYELADYIIVAVQTPVAEEDKKPTYENLKAALTDVNLMFHKDPTDPNSLSAWQCRGTVYTATQLNAYKFDNALYIPHIDKILDTNRIKENNRHYESMDELGLNLADPKILKSTTQETKLHRFPEAISGLLSTRAFGEAYYTAGTNRAAFAFSMQHFLCKDMESLNDTTIPDYRNRRDIDRSPGGESTTYKNRCIGCHAGMDGMTGAFAYYNFNGAITYEYGVVVSKMNHNVVFPDGFVTQSDSWINLWNQGKNVNLGWAKVQPSTGTQALLSGNGVPALAKMLSQTEAFYSCMAEQVFNKVCFRVKDSLEKSKIETIVHNTKLQFKTDKNMKNLFRNTAVACVEI
jgi:hypothetical protein